MNKVPEAQTDWYPRIWRVRRSIKKIPAAMLAGTKEVFEYLRSRNVAIKEARQKRE
jgi:hypothetical protein